MGVLLALLLWQAPPFAPAVDQFPDLPPLHEAREFGYTQPEAREQWLRHCRHYDWLVRAQWAYPFMARQQWEGWLAESVWRRDVYDTLDDALDVRRLGEEACRNKLIKLRGLLGDKGYDKRWLPMEYPLLMYPELP